MKSISQIIEELNLDRGKVSITIVRLNNGSIVATLSIEVFGDNPEEVTSTVDDISTANFTSLDVGNQTFSVEPLEIIGKIGRNMLSGVACYLNFAIDYWELSVISSSRIVIGSSR